METVLPLNISTQYFYKCKTALKIKYIFCLKKSKGLENFCIKQRKNYDLMLESICHLCKYFSRVEPASKEGPESDSSDC